MDSVGSNDPAEIIEAYYARGWTDGLPVLPPTEKIVAEMLAAAGLQAEEIVGTIPARSTVVVARKVAINAVMAGCRPEYLPVVVAAVRGLCHPDFAYHGPASSTGGSARERRPGTSLPRSVALPNGPPGPAWSRGKSRFGGCP